MAARRLIPCRIQRKRTKGWRMPRHTKYVGRGSPWGNPCNSGKDYAAWLRFPHEAPCVDTSDVRMAMRRHWILTHVHELRGWNLACWCPLPKRGEPDLCHGAILLAISNSD